MTVCLPGATTDPQPGQAVLVVKSGPEGSPCLVGALEAEGTVPGEVWLSVAPGVGVRLTKDGKPAPGAGGGGRYPHGERAGGGPMTAPSCGMGTTAPTAWGASARPGAGRKSWSGCSSNSPPGGEARCCPRWAAGLPPGPGEVRPGDRGGGVCRRGPGGGPRPPGDGGHLGRGGQRLHVELEMEGGPSRRRSPVREGSEGHEDSGSDL